MRHPDMDELTAKGEDESFLALSDRLVDEYGAAREPDIAVAIREERRRFTEAGVRSFLPVLVERSVRDRLTHA